MYKIIQLKGAPEIRRVIQAADASYRKTSAMLTVQSRVTLSGTYWSDGSRTTYHAVEIATGRVLPAPQYDPPQYGGPRQDPTVDIPDGVAIVATGVFCGKTATASVYINPRTVTPALQDL